MNRALALPPLRALPQPTRRVGLLGVGSLLRQVSSRASYRVAWGLALVVVVWEGVSLLRGASSTAAIPTALWIVMWCTTFCVGLTLSALHGEGPLVRMSRVRGRDAVMGRWSFPVLRFRVAIGIHGGATLVLAFAASAGNFSGLGPELTQFAGLAALSIAYSVALSAWASLCQWVLPTAAARLFWVSIIVPSMFHSALVELPSVHDVMFSLTECAVGGNEP